MPDLPDIPQFSLPFRLDGNGDFAYTEQDTLDEIADEVQIVVRYPLGYLPEAQTFGIPEQEFRMGGADRAVIQAQIEESVTRERASVLTTAELDGLVAEVRIDVKGGDA